MDIHPYISSPPDDLFPDDRERKRVRCISLWQPWASLMASGWKVIETRGWDTFVRGTVFIHAAKTLDGINECRRLDPRYRAAMEEALRMPFERWEKGLPFGQLIGRGDLYSTMSASAALSQYPSQEPFGNFAPGRFGHLYRNLEPIDPIPLRGGRLFFFADIPSSKP